MNFTEFLKSLNFTEYSVISTEYSNLAHTHIHITHITFYTYITNKHARTSPKPAAQSPTKKLADYRKWYKFDKRHYSCTIIDSITRFYWLNHSTADVCIYINGNQIINLIKYWNTITYFKDVTGFLQIYHSELKWGNFNL